ncbi:MAG: CoA-acylating methylmalonate-semialdehyde dehydrogenase [Myxococcota bacterium]
MSSTNPVHPDLPTLPDAPAEIRHLIGGEWRAGGVLVDVHSPYSGEVIARVPLADEPTVDACVAAAKAASVDWRGTPLKERTQRLFRFRELLLRDLDTLAHLCSSESGKTVVEARAGIMKGVEVIEFALSIQNLDDGAVLEVSRGVSCEVRREPLGVVVGITPFNFPAMVPMWLFPIAVTVGNAFVLKPSEKVPLTAVAMAERMVEAGFPPGVFSVLHGDKAAVRALARHADVAALAFIGSTPVARAVYVDATSSGKRALCLGGAKNHLIVVPDADRDVAVDGIVRSFTGCAGQRCMAASLMVAVGDVRSILDAACERAKSMVLGRDMGAIIDATALERLHKALQAARAEGAAIRVDGRNAPAPKGFEGGYWLGPTILEAKPEMDCAKTELFGPVLTVVHVETLEEAMALGDANVYGNATSVFTTRGAVARFVAARAQAGMIGVNVGVPVPREPFSFGGTKASRFGMGDITGRAAIELWSEQKKITTKWSMQSDMNWMS